MKQTYLSDSDIMDWNYRIPQNRPYSIIARYSSMNSQPTIVFVRNNNQYNSPYNPIGNSPTSYGQSEQDCNEPEENFKFVFSISSNREDDFWDIFNKLRKKGFINNVKNGNGTHKPLNYNDKIVQSKSNTIHKVQDKEYIRYEFLYAGHLSEIMAHVTLLEQTIELFSKIWGYDEDGKEYNLLKFPIGSIASPFDNKGRDLIVLDYDYDKNGKDYYINYIVSEMIYDPKSPVIKYGDVITVAEANLTFSRNGRIDDLLN